MKRSRLLLPVAIAAVIATTGCAGAASPFVGTTWSAFDSSADAESALVELRFSDDGESWSLTGDENYSGDVHEVNGIATLNTMGGAASWSVEVSGDGDGATLALAQDAEGSMPGIFKTSTFYGSADQAETAREKRIDDIRDFVEESIAGKSFIMKVRTYGVETGDGISFGITSEMADYARLSFDGEGEYEAEALAGDPKHLEEDYRVPLGKGTYEVVYDDVKPVSDYEENGVSVQISFDGEAPLRARVSSTGISWSGSGSYDATFTSQ